MIRHRIGVSAVRALGAELRRWQQRVGEQGERVLVLLEGRDAAGKSGALRALGHELDPRSFRVVALGPPDERERRQWYFQRWVRELPAAGEIVACDRSWYNRAGLERVLGFCTEAQAQAFLSAAPAFEALLVADGIRLVKVFLEIRRDTQARRLERRAGDTRKALRMTDIDRSALARYDAYSAARDEMLARTSTAQAPWRLIHADHKPSARRALVQTLIEGTVT